MIVIAAVLLMGNFSGANTFIAVLVVIGIFAIGVFLITKKKDSIEQIIEVKMQPVFVGIITLMPAYRHNYLLRLVAQLYECAVYFVFCTLSNQVESLTNFRVSGVELRFPAPSHCGHSFLESPSPIVPLP